MKLNRMLLQGVVTVVSMLGISSEVSAADFWHISTLKWIYPLGDGSIVLTLDTEHASCTNPSTPKQYVLSVGQNGVTADGLKNIYAVAMLALAQEKQLAINFSDFRRQVPLAGLFHMEIRRRSVIFTRRIDAWIDSVSVNGAF